MCIGPQRGPKSTPAISAEVKQVRTLLPEEYMSERLRMILGLEKATPKEAGSMKVRYTMTKEELEEMIIENLSTEHEINNIDFVCGMDKNSIPYLDRVEINCEA